MPRKKGAEQELQQIPEWEWRPWPASSTLDVGWNKEFRIKHDRGPSSENSSKNSN